MTAIGPIKIKEGDMIKDQIKVVKKIGEGACGQVFLVHMTEKEGKVRKAAMKVEALMRSKEDEILKMEIFVLKKMQHSRHICRCIASGKMASYTYVVMSLLGREISDLRKLQPSRKMTTPSVIRIGIQLVRALQDLHEAGFVHRDVKPSNVAMGKVNPQVVYIFDFGLARQILVPDGSGKLKLREPRTKTMFRGTVRYCSLNVHQYKEQGRHDDLYGALYSLIECASGNLPWKGQQRKDAAKSKENASDANICKDCPKSFLEIAKVLRKLSYNDVPPYKAIMDKLRSDLPKNIKMTDPYEWSKAGEARGEGDDIYKDKTTDRAEADKGESDNYTVNEVEDSVVTEDKDSNETIDHADFGKEDTLEGL